MLGRTGSRWKSPNVDDASGQGQEPKTAVLPIRADLVAELRGWREECGNPGPSSRVFGQIPKGLIRRFKRDLAAAGIPYEDEAGRQLDVHALRHTTASHLAEGGVAPRTAQQLMRHSKLDLTMQVYTDPRLLDTATALDSLPKCRPAQSVPEVQRATGTDGKNGAENRAGNWAEQGSSKRWPLSSLGNEQAEHRHDPHLTTPGETRTSNIKGHCESRADNKKGNSGRRDSNAQQSAWKAKRP